MLLAHTPREFFMNFWKIVMNFWEIVMGHEFLGNCHGNIHGE
jgi:hypothetical protein